MPSAHVRPLVFRRGAFGDMVILMLAGRGAVAPVRRSRRRPRSGSWSLPLLEGQPGVGEVHVVGSRRTPFLVDPLQRRRSAGARAQRAAPGLDLRHRPLGAAPAQPSRARGATTCCSRRATARSCQASITSTAGCGSRTTRRPPLLAADSSMRTTLADWRTPPLSVPPDWRRRARGAGSRAAGWVTVGSCSSRPATSARCAGGRHAVARRTQRLARVARWAAVIQRVLAAGPRTRRRPARRAGRGSRQRRNRPRGSHRRGSTTSANELPIPRLLALQSVASGMISVDTGPAHSAAALGCPLVVLFGDARVERYAPRSPTRPRRVPAGATAGARRRIEGITTERGRCRPGGAS